MFPTQVFFKPRMNRKVRKFYLPQPALSVSYVVGIGTVFFKADHQCDQIGKIVYFLVTNLL